ncbi:MAG: carboxypeptidase regulatory-like domain-containing protein [Chromatiaceae bacterium]|nr:carboxypeptidase regulatory-like domain-containing protein [Chromatiaceae bacterium]MBP8283117.1 carboxypeptidase regulatory-like domain-containing protein [Chromatiaceae bacterium]MBP8289521.1 carboxypeptidase regulatory-like domain-containing protein [Chromatiaceae bacterium]
MAWFPNTPSTGYWSSSPYADGTDFAWVVLFYRGYDGYTYKAYGDGQVRLVRGGQALPFDPSCVSSLSPLQREHLAAGGSGTVAVSAKAGCAWQANSNAPWIQVTAGQSGTGTGEVTYQVAANTLTNGRIGTLTIGGHAFSISQAGSGAVVRLADLGGVVRNAATGLPLGGASVQLGAAQTVSQAGTGAYAFAGVAAGDYSLTASKAGYGTVVQAVTLAPLTSAARDIPLRPVSGTPQVNGITTQYDKRFYFLEGASHELDFTTQVDWAGQTPQTVRLTMDKHVYDVPAGSGQVVKRLDAGVEFGACGGLKAQALWATGASQTVGAGFGVMSNPFGVIPWSRTDKGDAFAYKPTVWVDMDFFGSDAAEAIVVPAMVPLFGGHDLKFDYW